MAGDIITSRVSLSDIAEQGFEELVANRDRHVKILAFNLRDNAAGARYPSCASVGLL